MSEKPSEPYLPNDEQEDKDDANTNVRPLSRGGKERDRIPGLLGVGGKRVAVVRGSSPSHLHVSDGEEVSYGPAFSLDLPGRDTQDTLLRAVSTLYYRPRAKGADAKEVYVDAAYDVTQYSTLAMLQSPLRKPLPLDHWAPKELALFEAGICTYGKDFPLIQKLVRSKTTSECVEFYYKCWKLSQHYGVWKSFQTRSKEEDVTSAAVIEVKEESSKTKEAMLGASVNANTAVKEETGAPAKRRRR